MMDTFIHANTSVEDFSFHEQKQKITHKLPQVSEYVSKLEIAEDHVRELADSEFFTHSDIDKLISITVCSEQLSLS